MRRFLRAFFHRLLKFLEVMAIIACGGVYGGVRAMNDIQKGNPHEIVCRRQKLKTDESVVARLTHADHYVTWKSSNEKVLSVVGSGLSMPRTATIIGKKKGTATVTAITDGKKYTADFTVTAQKFHRPVKLDPLKYLKMTFHGRDGTGYATATPVLEPSNKDQEKVFRNFDYSWDDSKGLKNGDRLAVKIQANQKVMDEYNVTFEKMKRTFRVHGLSYRMNEVPSQLGNKAYAQTGCSMIWFGKGRKQDILTGIKYSGGSYRVAVCYGADSRGRFSWEWKRPPELYSTDDAISYVTNNFASYTLTVI